MAPRPKRKFESDDEAADQAGFRVTGRSGETSRTDPTPDTQSLYDDMRRIEEGLDMDERLQLQNGPAGPAPYLQPPTVSQAPTSPRSPASTTHSLRGAFDDVAIEEEEPQNKKRKARRHGPLDNLKRARAALMRKIGACADCKARRVRCNHFDSTKFEQEYQRRKRRELGISAASQPRGASPQVSQPSFNAPAVGQVGSWQPNLPTLYPADGNRHDPALEEIDSLFEGLPSGPTGPASPYYFTEDRPLRLMTSLPPNLLGPQPVPFNNVIPQMPLSPLADHRLPMGRNVGGIWECKHGDDDNLSPFGACRSYFRSLDDLRRHFESAHFPYSEEIEMHKCTVIRAGNDRIERVCGMLCDDDKIPCYQCGGQQWELWRYVFVSRTPSLTSGPSVHVGSQDGSAMGGYGQRQNNHAFGSGQGQFTDFEMLFPGRYPDWNSQQGGSQYSYNGKSAKASSDKCFPVNISPQGCRYGIKCRSLQSQYAVKGPFVIFISTLSLFVTSLGNKEILSAVVDSMRNHVFWMSLLCVFVGLAGMWLFKHISFRLDEGCPSTCDQRCLARDIFDIPQLRDIEDTGSMSGEEETLILDVLGRSGASVVG